MFVAGGLARATIEASPGSRTGIGAAATFFVFLYTMVFGATWLTVPWLYPAEIFPLQVRARGNAWGVVGWSIGNGWTVSYHPVRKWWTAGELSDICAGAPSPDNLQPAQ